MEIFEELIEAFAGAVQHIALNERIEHVGEPCRYVAFDAANSVTWSMVVNDGQVVFVPRTFRLLVEPVSSMRERVPTHWITQ